MAPHITFGPQLDRHGQCALAICTFHLGFSLVVALAVLGYERGCRHGLYERKKYYVKVEEQLNSLFIWWLLICFVLLVLFFLMSGFKAVGFLRPPFGSGGLSLILPPDFLFRVVLSERGDPFHKIGRTRDTTPCRL